MAEQVAVVPPFVPAHDQLHVPLPVTEEAVPLVQRLLFGAMVKVAPLLVPQTPFITVEGIRVKVTVIV